MGLWAMWLRGDLYERLGVCRNCGGILCRHRLLRPLLRKTVGAPMETIIVGIVALLLFVYLFVAMVRPEKF